MAYEPRIIDDQLDVLCGSLPAIVIEGPRAVGKTETAARRARTIRRLDDPTELALAQAEPSRLTTGDLPILVDEWQRWPSSWDLVRQALDADFSPNRFLLTGSVEPSQLPSHTGAGRFVVLRMYPMSLAERGLGAPTVSLGDLLSGDVPALDGATDVTLTRYAEEITKSGFPGIRTLDPAGRQHYLRGYLSLTFNYAIDDRDGRPRQDPGALRRWSRAYAAATSTTTAFDTIRDSATPGEADKPTRRTADAIRDTLERAHVIQPLEAWEPTFNRLRRLGEKPKHHLTDPALAAEVLGVDAATLLASDAPPRFHTEQRPFVAALFESLMVQSVRVYAGVHQAEVSHLRTAGGEHEVDIIVERRDGGIVALEVKLAAVAEDTDFRHLRWLKRTIGDQLVDVAVITTGQHAYRRQQDGFGVIPAALLGP